jgi:hypothetical protein
VISTFCVSDYAEEWDLPGLVAEVTTYWPTNMTADHLAIEASTTDELYELLMGEAQGYYEQREEDLGEDVMRQVERQIMLQIIDTKWREHLYEMDYLQEGIHLRAMGQKDPLVEWQREGFDMFGQMMHGIAQDFVKYVLHAQIALLLAPLLLGACALSACPQGRKAPSGPSDASVVASALPTKPGLWREVPLGSSLHGFAEAAFTGSASLVSDGTRAVFDPGDGPRPIEVPVPLPRVFAAGRRLFAAGENEGAPFLIALEGDEQPQVIPVPCPVSLLAGDGERYLVACSGASGLAASRDGASSFRKIALDLPEPPAAGAQVRRALEAVAVTADGVGAFAATQRWRSKDGAQDLLWIWAHVGVRMGDGNVRYAAVPGLARAFGLKLAGSGFVLAGLEVAADGAVEGELRPRLFRGSDEAAVLPEGVPGPSCGMAADSERAQGVLLGPREAAFLCEGKVVVTLDGGASWKVEAGLPASPQLLEGGDMRLVAIVGGKAWERRFPARSATGAIAVRVAPAKAVPSEQSHPDAGLARVQDGGERIEPKLGGAEVREPDLDGGLRL